MAKIEQSMTRIHLDTLREVRRLAKLEGRSIPEQIQYMLDSYIGQAKSDDAKLRELIRNAK